MKPFKQEESGYTATAKNVTLSGVSPINYDVDVLDNPVRKKVNFVTIQANIKGYKRYATV